MTELPTLCWCFFYTKNVILMLSLAPNDYFPGNKSLQLESARIPWRFKTNHRLLSSFEISRFYFAVKTNNSSSTGYFFQRIKRRKLNSDLLAGLKFRFFVEVLCGEWAAFVMEDSKFSCAILSCFSDTKHGLKFPNRNSDRNITKHLFSSYIRISQKIIFSLHALQCSMINF